MIKDQKLVCGQKSSGGLFCDSVKRKLAIDLKRFMSSNMQEESDDVICCIDTPNCCNNG